MPCGPNRVPGRYVVPASSGAPKIADLGIADIMHILDVRALHEGAPLAGEVRDLTPGEGGQGPVGDRLRRLQAVRESALDLLLMAPVRQERLGLLGSVSFAIDAVLIIFGHSGPSSRRGAFR